MRKTLLTVCAAISMMASAQSVTVNVTAPGTLSTLIAESEKNTITDLRVTGEINGSDVKFLREMAGRDEKDNQTEGTLARLDLLDARIVSGGDSYYTAYEKNYATADDTIGWNMFDGCYSLRSVTLPKGTKAVANFAFNFSKIESVTLSEGLVTIGGNAFAQCKSLKSVVIPNSVTTISGSAFNGAAALESVTLGTGTRILGDEAFAFCDALTSIQIPASVDSIGNEVFESCAALAAINVSEDNASFKSADGILFNADMTQLLRFPVAKANTSYEIPAGITKIGKGAFSRCKNLTSVTMSGGGKKYRRKMFPVLYRTGDRGAGTGNQVDRGRSIL